MKNSKEYERKKPGFILPVIVAVLFVTAAAILTYSIFLKPDADSEALPSDSVVTEASTAESQREFSEPEQILLSYMSKIEEKDYEGMYEYLSDVSKEAFSLENFCKRQENIYEGIGATDILITIRNTDITENSSLIIYQTDMQTQAGSLSFTNQMDLTKKKNEGFKIEWDTMCIFPQLKDGYKVQNNRVTGIRGSIYDRNDTLLAGNGKAATIGFVPGRMSETPEEDIKRASELLQVSEASIQAYLSAPYVGPDIFVPIRTISDPKSDVKAALLDIPGIQINEISARIYPLGEAAAHITGYVQAINAEELEAKKDMGYTQNSKIGKVGLEALYEDRLKETNGREIKIVDAYDHHVHTLAFIPAKNGESIKLTIDAGLQMYLYNSLSEEKSVSVAMQPKTGEILALVSTPSYDPNRFSVGLLDSEWAALRDDPRNPMFNRFRGCYAPGSSFKPITAAIGMTSQTIDPYEDFGSSGSAWQKDSSWGNYHVTTLASYEGPHNMANALMYSDNIYFAKAALGIGNDAFSSTLDSMGFSESIPFEMTLDFSGYSQNENGLSSSVLLADTGYGQGQLLLNPVHFSSMYSSFSNRGDMLTPYLLYDENVTPTIWKEDVFSEETAQFVRDALIQVVENPAGSGHNAKIENVLLAGKTGTAEIKTSQSDTSGTELGWFAAFTADDGAEKPIQIIVMVEDVKGRGGSHFVSPFVRDAIEYYLVR